MAGEDDRVDNPDEQYQFSDDMNTTEQFELEGEEAPPKPSFLQTVLQFFARNRPLAFFLFMVFAVSVVYQFVSTPGSPKQTVVVAATEDRPTKTDTVDAQQSAALSGQMDTLQKNIEQQINDFKKVSQANQSVLVSLKSELGQARQTIAQLAADNAQFKSSQYQLSAQLKKINNTLYPVDKVDPLRYYIEAIVPGRAWLSSNKGDYMTVELGTELPQYGAIRQINSDTGLVVTSSGKMIHFSADE